MSVTHEVPAQTPPSSTEPSQSLSMASQASVAPGETALLVSLQSPESEA